MIEIKNPNFVSKIEAKAIRVIDYDYELKLEDLHNIVIELGSQTTYQLNVSFDPIYIRFHGMYVELSMITSTGYKSYKLCGEYNADKLEIYKYVNVTLSQDLIEYLSEKHAQLLKERNVSNEYNKE